MSNKVLLADDRIYHNQQYDYPEQDVNYRGRKLDNDLKHGPIQSRGCRDILFVILYLGLWALMIFCAIKSWDKGDTSLIYEPFDSNKNHCGIGALSSYKNVYILSANEFYCVSSCPGANDVDKELPCYQCGAQTAPYKSAQIVTLCFPTVSEDSPYLKLVRDIVDIGGFQEHYSDLEETWPIILACAGIAFVVAILLTFLIKLAAGCIVWGMIALYLLLVSGAGTLAYLQSTGQYEELKVIDDQKSLEIIAYICWSIAGLSLLIILCLIKKISLAIKILKTAADYTREEWQAMFVPIITFILVLGFVSYWLIFSALIYSTSAPDERGATPYVKLEWNASTGWQLLVYGFGLLWNVCFALSLCQFVIASSCCMWYYSHQGNSSGGSIIGGFCRGFTTSFGSLLLGSLVLAIVWTIKIILEVIHKQLKDSVGGDHNALGYALRCAKYCVTCFERFIRFLNQNAYTMMALTGQSFCSAAYDAFYLITRNAVRVAITHGLGELFEFMGAIFISVSTAFIGYLIITSESYQNKIISPLAPTIAFAIVAYLIGKMFMNLYGMGVDTLLMCYLVDYELHKNEGGPKSAPPSLKEYVSEYE